MAGQDVFTCGVIGAAFTGLMASGSVLNRNTIGDLEALHKKLSTPQKEKTN